METGGRSGDGETGAAGRGATREPFPRTGASFGTRPASGVAAAEGRVECAFAVSSRKAAIGAGSQGTRMFIGHQRRGGERKREL